VINELTSNNSEVNYFFVYIVDFGDPTGESHLVHKSQLSRLNRS
jgi:hypothetical protein